MKMWKKIAMIAIGLLLAMPYSAYAVDLWTEQPGFQLGNPPPGNPPGNSEGNPQAPPQGGSSGNGGKGGNTGNTGTGNPGNAGQNNAQVQQLQSQIQTLQRQLQQLQQQYQQLQQQHQQLRQQNEQLQQDNQQLRQQNQQNQGRQGNQNQPTQQLQQENQRLRQENQRLREQNQQLQQEVQQLREENQQLQQEVQQPGGQNEQNNGNNQETARPQIHFNPPAGYEEIVLHRRAFLKDGKVMVPISYLLYHLAYSDEGDRNQARFYKDSSRMDHFLLRNGSKTASFTSKILNKPSVTIELEEAVSTFEGCMNTSYYSCWYLPLDSRITEYFGYKAEWHPQDRVVTLGNKYYFKVYDEHWTVDELKWRQQYVGTWDLFLMGTGNQPQQSWGTLEIRENGTMVWDDKVEVNRGRWELSPEKSSEVITTNGFNGYRWNLDFMQDGTLKVYGHTMTFIGFKRFPDIPTTFNPPAGMKEIKLQTPAFIDNNQIYINSAAVRSLKGVNEWNFNAIRLGSDYFYYSISDGTYYTNQDRTKKPLSAKPQVIDGVLYFPAKEVVKFLGYEMTHNRTHQVLLLDNEFFLKIVDKPMEPEFP